MKHLLLMLLYITTILVSRRKKDDNTHNTSSSVIKYELSGIFTGTHFASYPTASGGTATRMWLLFGIRGFKILHLQ